jgi:glutathione synthase
MATVGLMISNIENLQNKNLLIFSNAMLKVGHQPILILADSLSLAKNKILALCFKLKTNLNIGDSIDIKLFTQNKINNLDYIWVLNFGYRQNFLDIIEFLWMLEKYNKVKFVNSVESLLYFSNKYILNFLPNFIKIPKSYASNNAEYLHNIVSNDKKLWVLKPPAESMGKNIFILKNGDTNIKALIQILTGNQEKHYCILQEFIHKIAKKGEKRVIIARGKIICCYKRISIKNEHRTNLSQGAKAVISKLTNKEKKYCLAIADYFKKIGVNYIGLDMVFPYILEINVVNPGGLGTLKEISNYDYSNDVIKQIIK